MRTIKDWFNDLPEEERVKALANTPEEDLKIEKQCLSEAIAGAFIWTDVPENNEYWNTIYRRTCKKEDHKIEYPIDNCVDWKEEMDKCIESPYYFYTTYFMVDGKKATTFLSEEEFNKSFKLLN